MIYARMTRRALGAAIVAVVVSGCTIDRLNVEAVGGDPFFIVDRDSKIWNITYAVENYQMDPGRFQYGLGKNAILPLIDPQFVSPGNPNYPASGETFLVIGTEIDGDTRAYRKRVVARHEVVVEMFGDTPVAVSY